MIEKWEWLTAHIPVGQDNAISAEDLSRILDLEQRNLRRAVEAARRDNMLICGDHHGYYLPANDEEINTYIHRVRRRIRTGCVCLAPFVRKIKEAEETGKHGTETNV